MGVPRILKHFYYDCLKPSISTSSEERMLNPILKATSPTQGCSEETNWTQPDSRPIERLDLRAQKELEGFVKFFWKFWHYTFSLYFSYGSRVNADSQIFNANSIAKRMGSEIFEIHQTYFSLISLTVNAQTTLLTVLETTRVTLLFSELVFYAATAIY